MDINTVIEQILDGDVNAFRCIVSKYSPEIKAFFTLRLSNSHAIDDLVQEVLFSAYWNLRSFDPDANFGAWLQGVTKNKFKEYLRKCKTHKEKIIRESVPLMEYLDVKFSDNGISNELIDKLKGCIKKLPDKFRALTEKRYLYNQSVQLIAEECNSTVDAVSCSLYRIKKKLKLCIENKNE